ncbi:hypothetical protein F5B20DRAFT_168874 [Whalleya microplaca]|nr:hypothetical protein F5B20DRAFT_168874 [Whalleya microplaca]
MYAICHLITLGFDWADQGARGNSLHTYHNADLHIPRDIQGTGYRIQDTGYRIQDTVGIALHRVASSIKLMSLQAASCKRRFLSSRVILWLAQTPHSAVRTNRATSLNHKPEPASSSLFGTAMTQPQLTTAAMSLPTSKGKRALIHVALLRQSQVPARLSAVALYGIDSLKECTPRSVLLSTRRPTGGTLARFPARLPVHVTAAKYPCLPALADFLLLAQS